MSIDKQLRGVDVREVRRKRDADQALNIKEFAVLAGISYSVARDWFQSTGFPKVHGLVFWEDFVLWRRWQSIKKNAPVPSPIENGAGFSVGTKPHPHWPQRAAQILAESSVCSKGA